MSSSKLSSPAMKTNAVSVVPAIPVQQRARMLSETQVKRLMEDGFPRGLAHSLTKTTDSFPLRTWIVDNSGSMNNKDGHRVSDNSSISAIRTISCSRWEEIRESVNYHVRMAGLLSAPTSFRLLNRPRSMDTQHFEVAKDPNNVNQDVADAISFMSKVEPGGGTPLTEHIQDIHKEVTALAPELHKTGKRVVIVIATDGMPNGGRAGFVEAMRKLEGLPVWVVIRLCTDDDDVVNFYNDLDDQLELSLEVLDDFEGEAAEVYEFNSWLNYALPLHRCREMGYHDRVFDLIDERALVKSEIRDFCALLFGEDKLDGVPDPSSDWKGFSDAVEKMLQNEKPLWNPMKKKATPWIDMKKLNKKYGRNGKCSIM